MRHPITITQTYEGETTEVQVHVLGATSDLALARALTWWNRTIWGEKWTTNQKAWYDSPKEPKEGAPDVRSD